MDADILRLILFLAGVGLILGIYFWDRHKRVNVVVHAIKKAQKEEQPSILSEPEIDEEREEPTLSGIDGSESEALQSAGTAETGTEDWDVDAREIETLPDITTADEIPSLQVSTDEVAESVESVVDDDLEQLDAIVLDDEYQSGEQIDFSFTAEEPEDPADDINAPGIPLKILQLNVIAIGGDFNGADISKAAEDLQMVYGDMAIYHRYDGDPGKGHVLFGMASLVEPGTFPPVEMENFSTPGLTLFAQLPGYQDGMAIFSDMLFTAERLAVMLNGHLQDESHSDLSKQRIANIREGILEHRRQVKLAHSKR